MTDPDPFTGTWVLSPGKSRLTGPLPRTWVQRIAASAEAVEVREEIVFADGHAADVTIDAKFDGAEYPVKGSPLADSIAFTRFDAFSISGTARRHGALALSEMMTVSADGNLLTHVFSIYGRERVAGVAVFERINPPSP
jgi:hypothetical protein